MHIGFAGGIYIAPAGIAAFGQSRPSCAHRLQVLSGEGCHHEDIRHSQRPEFHCWLQMALCDSSILNHSSSREFEAWTNHHNKLSFLPRWCHRVQRSGKNPVFLSFGSQAQESHLSNTSHSKNVGRIQNIITSTSAHKATGIETWAL